MNKLIYAIGIAVAATFASNTKIEHHQVKSKVQVIEQVSDENILEVPDSTKVEDVVKLP